MKSKALEGLKVVDLTWAVVGPKTCSYLSENGATVIKVESITRIDICRTLGPFRDDVAGVNRSATFSSFNCGKYSVAINLKKEQGVEATKKLIAWADVMVESMRGGAMSELGLGYEEVKKINPEIIMLSTCMYGQNGPHHNHPGHGQILSSLAGFNHITGWPDRGPSPIHGPYTDFVSPHLNFLALMAALDYKRRTGKGQYIDLSQYENGIHFLSPLVLDYIVNKREPVRMGNRCSQAAPHGVYCCEGDERWCAISVFADEEWQDFCRVIGNPEWTSEERFSSLERRLENQDDLDQLIEAWTAHRKAEDVMLMMQKAGVAAAIVANGEDICNDPQLAFRGFFQEVEHEEFGRQNVRRQAFIASKTPVEMKPPPSLGEHNEYVFTKLLGMSDEEFVQLVIDEVFE